MIAAYYIFLSAAGYWCGYRLCGFVRQAARGDRSLSFRGSKKHLLFPMEHEIRPAAGRDKTALPSPAKSQAPQPAKRGGPPLFYLHPFGCGKESLFCGDVIKAGEIINGTSESKGKSLRHSLMKGLQILPLAIF